MLNIIGTKNEATEAVKSNCFDFFAKIEDEVIPAIVKDIPVSQSNNGSCNEGYKISNDRYDKQPIGYLYKYDCHLYCVMTYGTTYTKEYCGYLKDGLMIGYTPECGIGNYEEANNNRKLFHDFLKRYMGGEFKYRKSFHHASKPKYYNDLPKQVQRNIKRVVDTLNEIYNVA